MLRAPDPAQPCGFRRSLARALHAGGRRFESCTAHLEGNPASAGGFVVPAGGRMACGGPRCCAAMQRRLPLIAVLTFASAAATVTAARATPSGNLQPRNGEWIAYSTVPGDNLSRPGAGSDVFVVQEHRTPIVIASREDGRTAKGRSWNVCPAFSPDGTMLAFGTRSPAGLSISVVRMTRAGRSAHLEVREGRLPPCPQWSADSSRLAYVRGRKVIVRRLDGSSPHRRVGDPVIQDFRGRHDAQSLTSPTGDLVARRADSFCGVVVERPDGSHRRNVDVGCTYPFYAVAAWSPDERKLLLMRDVSSLDFSMYAVSIYPPFEVVPVVERVHVNSAHSWPGRFDVSWQPRPS